MRTKFTARVTVVAACLAIAALVPGRTVADPQHANMAEPIFGDTVTDIDGDEAGEVEVDLRGEVQHSHGVTWPAGEVGVEGRVTRRLGFEVEGAIAGTSSHGYHGDVTLRAAVSLWHGVRHDFHVQIEGGGSYDQAFGSASEGTLPSTTDGAPFRLGVRVGYRYRRLTLRGGVGAAFSSEGSAPVWADVAGYAEFGARHGDTSSVGVEAVSDWTSQTPVIVAPELALAFHGGDAHVALGFPIFLGNRVTGAYAGGFVTLIIEFGEHEE